MQRILVLRRGGLGDTLLMLPVLRALRRAHPAAELTFAGVPEFAAVLQQHGACDRVRSSEDLALWSRATAAARLAGYDPVVADDPAVAAATAAARVFDPRPRDERPLARQLAAQLGLALQWPADAWLTAAATGARSGPVAFAPGSGGRAKCWPRERWLGLASALADTARPPQVVVGPAELERDDPRRWPWPDGTAFVVEPQVTALADRLAGVAAFAGNDSGTTHLAAMLGVPTVALFGPSDARVFAPQGPDVCVLTAGGDITAIPVDAVAAALRQPGRSAAAR